MITEILKGQLGFSGLVVTDSMQMGAITDEYSSADAAILALQAGCDIILMPENLVEAFDGVVAAIEDGRLSEQWLDETVLRILEFKQQHKLLN
jgi:beta-N-acetylhexosaminidase